ncbi:MAG: AgmX/PglI C-terminal domain-containing protein [Polyangiales bacterium]
MRGLCLATFCWLAACSSRASDLSTAELSAVVDAQRPALKQCYDHALERSPYKQDMRMDAIIEIAASGRVTSVALHGAGGLPGMNDCLRAAIKRWQFPRAKASTATSLPLVFHPDVKPAQPNLEPLKQAFQQLGAKAR